MAEYSVIPNDQLPEAPPHTVRQRLVSSLYEACCFSRGADTSWMDKGMSNDCFMDGLRAFSYEDEGYRRSELDMQSLTVSALLMLLHWRYGRAERTLFETVWRRAQFPQSAAVRPLAGVIAANTLYVDPEVTVLEQGLLLSCATLEELERVDLRPLHIRAAVQPIVDIMAIRLESEGHKPGDWDYFHNLRGQPLPDF